MTEETESPTPRPAARVLLFDSEDRLLLLQFELDDGRMLWIAPGGGLNPGESHEEAAIRELWEELGVTGVELGPCIWHRTHAFYFAEEFIEQQEHYFVCHVGEFDIDESNREELERNYLRANRWWPLAEIAASSELFVPRELAGLLAPILRGEYPSEPIVVGI